MGDGAEGGGGRCVVKNVFAVKYNTIRNIIHGMGRRWSVMPLHVLLWLTLYLANRQYYFTIQLVISSSGYLTGPNVHRTLL